MKRSSNRSVFAWVMTTPFLLVRDRGMHRRSACRRLPYAGGCRAGSEDHAPFHRPRGDTTTNRSRRRTARRTAHAVAGPQVGSGAWARHRHSANRSREAPHSRTARLCRAPRRQAGRTLGERARRPGVTGRGSRTRARRTKEVEEPERRPPAHASGGLSDSQPHSRSQRSECPLALPLRSTQQGLNRWTLSQLLCQWWAGRAILLPNIVLEHGTDFDTGLQSEER